MDALEKSIVLNRLYDQYQELLTDKQRLYFEQYYFEDFSITEISENMNVSRNAIHDQLKKVNIKLQEYEQKLQLSSKSQMRKNIYNQVESCTDINEIQNMIQKLKEIE
jgi:predicted DNA-binding protein YlxM (UPF0122 family)